MGSCSGEKSRSRSFATNGDRGAGILLLVLLAFVICLNSVAAQRVNCRKFVYAPICRGTASKRAFPSSEESDSFRIQARTLETRYNDYPATAIRERENKVGFRDIPNQQRQRQADQLYRRLDQEQPQKTEPFDPTIYDY